MLDALITSKTRIKLMLRFFLNSNTSSYLRNLETEFGESSNAIRIELNRFEKAGLLESFSEGNKKFYRANQTHPLFPDIHSIVLKYVGLDAVIDKVARKLGKLEKVLLCGGFASGLDLGIIDLIFVGDIDRRYLIGLVDKVEKLIKRRIRYIVYSQGDYLCREIDGEEVILWEKDPKNPLIPEKNRNEV